MKKPGALAEIEAALNVARSRHGNRIYGPCGYCDSLDRALSLLPRLREVVEAARCCYSLNIQANERLKAALAALEGGSDAGR